MALCDNIELLKIQAGEAPCEFPPKYNDFVEDNCQCLSDLQDQLTDLQNTVNNTRYGLTAGYIAFNGETNETIDSSNLTLTKTATGVYTISIDPTVQTGFTDYCVVLGNTDQGVFNQGASYADRALNLYNTVVSSRLSASFTIRAIRTWTQWRNIANDDQVGSTRFAIGEVDPSYVTAALYITT